MGKRSEEIRQKAVEEYLSGQGSSMDIAEKYKLRSGNLVLDWAKEYHRHRESLKKTGGISVARRKHTLEERVQAVREYLEDGKSFSELTETYSVTAQVVRNWVKRCQEMGVAGLEDRRGKRLAAQTPRTTGEALQRQKRAVRCISPVPDITGGVPEKPVPARWKTGGWLDW